MATCSPPVENDIPCAGELSPHPPPDEDPDSRTVERLAFRLSFLPHALQRLPGICWPTSAASPSSPDRGAGGRGGAASW